MLVVALAAFAWAVVRARKKVRKGILEFFTFMSVATIAGYLVSEALNLRVAGIDLSLTITSMIVGILGATRFDLSRFFFSADLREPVDRADDHDKRVTLARNISGFSIIPIYYLLDLLNNHFGIH